MSSFTKPVIVELLPHRTFKVHEAFEYYTGAKFGNQTYQIHKGFLTDLATIPRILWPIFAPHDEYAKAAIVHDYLYMSTWEKVSREDADGIFLEAMGVLNVPRTRKYLVWLAVRVFGWWFYQKRKM